MGKCIQQDMEQLKVNEEAVQDRREWTQPSHVQSHEVVMGKADIKWERKEESRTSLTNMYTKLLPLKSHLTYPHAKVSLACATVVFLYIKESANTYSTYPANTWTFGLCSGFLIFRFVLCEEIEVRLCLQSWYEYHTHHGWRLQPVSEDDVGVHRSHIKMVDERLL